MVQTGAGATEARPALRSPAVQDVRARGHAVHYGAQHQLRPARAAERQRSVGLLDHPWHRAAHSDHRLIAPTYFWTMIAA